MAYMGQQGSKDAIRLSLGLPLGPCDLYREQLQINVASYSTVNGTDSDDFRFNSNVGLTPARGAGPVLTNGVTAPAHAQDTTAYPVNSVRSDNWIEHVRGKRGVDTDTNNPV